LSFKINGTTNQNQEAVVGGSTLPTPTPRGLSGQRDALQAYVKAEQRAGGNCCVELIGTICGCVYSLFSAIFGLCCGSKKPESKPVPLKKQEKPVPIPVPTQVEDEIVSKFKECPGKWRFIALVEEINRSSEAEGQLEKLVGCLVNGQSKLTLKDCIAFPDFDVSKLGGDCLDAVVAFTHAYIRYALRQQPEQCARLLRVFWETNGRLFYSATTSGDGSFWSVFSVQERQTFRKWAEKKQDVLLSLVLNSLDLYEKPQHQPTPVVIAEPIEERLRSQPTFEIISFPKEWYGVIDNLCVLHKKSKEEFDATIEMLLKPGFRRKLRDYFKYLQETVLKFDSGWTERFCYEYRQQNPNSRRQIGTELMTNERQEAVFAFVLACMKKAPRQQDLEELWTLMYEFHEPLFMKAMEDLWSSHLEGVDELFSDFLKDKSKGYMDSIFGKMLAAHAEYLNKNRKKDDS
jgi:hypothetical protein